MEIEILEKKENPLLRRTEIRFKAAFMGATPTKKDVRLKLVAMLNSDKALTVLEKFENDYGAQTAKGYAKVYEDEQALKIEPEYLIKRNTEADAKEDKPKEEAPAAPATPAGGDDAGEGEAPAEGAEEKAEDKPEVPAEGAEAPADGAKAEKKEE